MNADQIVEARIHPAIGIARVGNSPGEYFLGPEIPVPGDPPQGGYRDAEGRLKRQAARFRVYGIDSHGNVVAELTSANAEIVWTVHVANRKSGWYEFDLALDLRPEAAGIQSPRRNPTVADRKQLTIDPGPRTVSGKNQASPPFDSGLFFGTPVYLGELRTDEDGRLLFLGGHGKSGSPFAGFTLTTFSNNLGWYDDIGDGPVDARVKIGGREIPVDPAWVVTAPPDYAPGVLPAQTMYELIFDALAGSLIPAVKKPSFTNDILPIFQRLSGLQWVNTGFLAQFGWGGPNDFMRADYLAKLSAPGPEFQELRRQIFYMFRNPASQTFESWQWPPIYGDATGVWNANSVSPRNSFSITATLYGYLTQWMNGDFAGDYNPAAPQPKSLDDYSLAEQPDTLDRAALTFCGGGPFHPGSEMTWIMRRGSLYRGKFRLRRHPEAFEYPDYGAYLNQSAALGESGPLAACGPGDITKWMSVPWQADSASCREGYSQLDSPQMFNADPYLPTFWPASAPNQVLAEVDYLIVMDTARPLAERIAAFNRRKPWVRKLRTGAPYLKQIASMVEIFGELGVVEKRDGVKGDSNFPPAMYVETLGGEPAPEADPETDAVKAGLMHARFGGMRRV